MNILFICNGNVARSQEAEGFFNVLAKNADLHAASAGINVKVGKPIDPMVVEVMHEIGYNLADKVRKFVTKDQVNTADVIVSFKPAHELPEYINQKDNVRYWVVSDPQQQSIEFHRKVRDEVKNKVEQLLGELPTKSSESQHHRQ